MGVYTLTTLPNGFSYGVPYGWFLGVYSPDGGYGESFYYSPVAFSNSVGEPLVPAVALAQHWRWLEARFVKAAKQAMLPDP